MAQLQGGGGITNKCSGRGRQISGALGRLSRQALAADLYAVRPQKVRTAVPRSLGECAYCAAPAYTEDHIPPQGVLIGVPRNARPWVPSCAPCNEGASVDDEYFRDVVFKYHRVAEKPEAAEGVARMLRALALPRKAGYASATLRSFTDVHTVSPAGLDLGVKPAFRVDSDRLARVMRRYIRGLHYLERGSRVPSAYSIHMYVNPEANLNNDESFRRVFEGSEQRIVKEGVFWYNYAIPSDRPSASAWLLVHFDACPFFAVVHPSETVPGAV